MVHDNLSVDTMLITWGYVWISGRGVLITSYDNMSPSSPLAWGMGPPPLPYPPLLYVIVSVWGDNPLYNDFKIFGKIIPFFDYLSCSKTYVYEKEYLFIC